MIMSDRSQTPPPGPGPAAGLGLQLAVGMAVFAGGGYWLDRKRGGGALFTLVGVGLGLFYGGYECWKVVRELNRDPALKQNDAKRRNKMDRG